jgi:putative molybdopterin biosynthesis protein
VADAGIAIESAALAEELSFIPLSQERFDLVLSESQLKSPAVSRFLSLIDQSSFRSEAGKLPGYDLSLSGHLTTLDASRPD